MLHAVVCPSVFILFYVRDWQGEVLKHMKNDHFLIFWVRFSLVFGLVKERLILECHEMIRVLHVVACPIHFYFDFWSRLARKCLKL